MVMRIVIGHFNFSIYTDCTIFDCMTTWCREAFGIILQVSVFLMDFRLPVYCAPLCYSKIKIFSMAVIHSLQMCSVVFAQDFCRMMESRSPMELECRGTITANSFTFRDPKISI